jgi:uncharacterized protein YkwD
VICPPPRARNHAGVIATLLLLGTLTACGSQPSAAWVKTGVTRNTAPLGSSASVQPDPYPTATATPSPSETARPPAPPVPPALPKPTKTKTAPKPPPPRGAGVSTAAQAVLDQTNAWRTAAGLPPYVMLSGLVASAHKHNLTMAAGCGLSHQCAGEAPFGDRIHAEGVNWRSAGENCGVGGGVSNNTSAITSSAKGLNQGMFDERPPHDGHRRNLLSSSFTHIGIDVVRGDDGNVWLTEDFTS